MAKSSEFARPTATMPADDGWAAVRGFTHASTVTLVAKLNGAPVLVCTTPPAWPVKETALPRPGGPAVNVGVETQAATVQPKLPVFPPPEASAVVVPVFSSNCQAPTSPLGAT